MSDFNKVVGTEQVSYFYGDPYHYFSSKIPKEGKSVMPKFTQK